MNKRLLSVILSGAVLLTAAIPLTACTADTEGKTTSETVSSNTLSEINSAAVSKTNSAASSNKSYKNINKTNSDVLRKITPLDVHKIASAPMPTPQELAADQKLIDKSSSKKIFPLSLEQLVNTESGKSVQLGMTRGQVEKVFPPPKNVKAKWSQNFDDATRYSYNGLHFTYRNDNGRLIYIVANATTNSAKMLDLPVTLDGQPFIGLKLKDVIKILGKPTDVLGEDGVYRNLYYTLIRTDEGLCIVDNNDPKNFDIETAKKMLTLAISFDIDGEFEGDEYHNYVVRFHLEDFYSWNEYYYNQGQ